MAEKGGKGFSLKPRKSSVKTPSAKGASLKGKDGSSNKKGRSVHFENSSDSEGSPRAKISVTSKSGGKFSSETPVSKGDWGKGGKGDKAGKAGGNSNLPKVPTIPELKIEEELAKNATCLMDCEAAVVLQGIQEQLVILSEDSTIKLPGSFDKGLQYAKSSDHYTNPQSVRRVLETLKSYNISDGEICLIANLCPETADEVFALIPSLKVNRLRIERAINHVLHELAKLKSI